MKNTGNQKCLKKKLIWYWLKIKKKKKKCFAFILSSKKEADTPEHKTEHHLNGITCLLVETWIATQVSSLCYILTEIITKIFKADTKNILWK